MLQMTPWELTGIILTTMIVTAVVVTRIILYLAKQVVAEEDKRNNP